MEKYVALSVKPLWDKYKFEENIDSGAFGSVMKVMNTEDKKFYAMKVQNLKNLMTRVPKNYSNEMVRIIREINTFKLSHQNITKFYESYFTDQDQFAIVTELAESNLYIFRENTTLTNAEIVNIMIQIMKGTIHLHKQNIMHRDLSPENILVFENGKKFKICDFGMAQLISKSNSFVGKHYFKAPEIAQNEEFTYNSQVDVWSLGVILYYLCTKQYEYQSKTITDLKHLDNTKLISLEGEQKVFEQIINKMLQYNPSLRINAQQVLCELCSLNNESLIKHWEQEEEKQSDNNLTTDDSRSAFAITIQSNDAVVNEIISKLRDFNYQALDSIHPNQNRIFMPLIKYTDGAQYQGEYDQVTQQADGRGRFIWSSGAIYDGLWKNNLRDGYG
ncbi:serine threonine-protein kinase nek3 [Stylonychia lemnae]|uniref:Serine threonine-protein kinase nek3 n=1 Tax=Stylonychia lemnae TaxID=5949 RepID=A0A078A001_STYLE|nr:serine threonine-protein kinase nek3 [Stylonychia lemnae]|eukprot:CDW75511.1 serine threonine-protein kinase nek3 [Stylonychia lemnae]